MPIFLLAVSLKGPVWLRVIAWLCVAAFLGLGFLLASANLHKFSERPVPAHVHHAPRSPAR